MERSTSCRPGVWALRLPKECLASRILGLERHSPKQEHGGGHESPLSMMWHPSGEGSEGQVGERDSPRANVVETSSHHDLSPEIPAPHVAERIHGLLSHQSGSAHIRAQNSGKAGCLYEMRQL